ncbi:MAG: hypothetical protein B6I20_01155 [Bacteroidetes bacterium 4572_117]|nr:MAG: hypothetical protein B6I20_01155 [Bacteroidetes bacterium 4572_117]
MFENKKNCYLRAFEPEDYEIVYKWRNNPEFSALTAGNVDFVSSEKEKQWVKEKIFNDKTENFWVICDKETNEPVGFTSIINIDFRNKNVWMGEMAINKENLDKGYELSKEIFAKMGFTVEGITREDVYKGGKFHDVVIVSLLEKEYRNQKT